MLTIFVIASLALIVACGGAAEEDTDSAPTAAPQATTAPQATAAPTAGRHVSASCNRWPPLLRPPPPLQ